MISSLSGLVRAGAELKRKLREVSDVMREG